MTKGRLEAFSDGVIAIIITIMVLELHAPEGHAAAGLRPLLPVFLSYVLSFVYVAIYWNNHHHMFHIAEKVNGRVLWANMHLLFWLSLIPFTTSWLGEHHIECLPVALYGAVLLMAGLAYHILIRTLISLHGSKSKIAQAIGDDGKGWISIALYAAAVGLAFLSPWVAIALYVGVALMWVVPDTRIEKKN